MNFRLFITTGLLVISTGCATDKGPNVKVRGEEKTAKTEVLETGAKVLQENDPVAAMDIYLVGFHPMMESPKHQMEAHHFCRQKNEDFAQCSLFDGNTADANLNGIEYIISEKLFNKLPEEEKKYWHPHNYEILSGQLFAPGLPTIAENALMKKKMNSYGKTWHVWNTGHHGLNDATKMPLGEPMLAWSFNHDGEAKKGLEEDTEEKFDVSFSKKRKDRKELVKVAEPQEGVNAIVEEFPGKISSIKGVEEKGKAQAQEIKEE
jgi:hypothetical protein